MNNPDSGSACDNARAVCRANDKPRLPRAARLPINRCNLPADILGSLTFQSRPCPLRLDGVEHLHRDLFAALDRIPDPADRALRFEDYLTVHFRLHRPEEMGLTSTASIDRHRATWLKLLRGWLFDADSRDAAVLKGWVESRFGLLPRHHRAALREPGGPAWRRYEEDRARGLYATSALEAQLDLVFTYCQYEFARAPGEERLTLYRGVNRAGGYEILERRPDGGEIWLSNNISSYSSSSERAGEFGDRVIRVVVPTAKVFCHSGLFPGRLRGEEEYMVIGGLYLVHHES